MCRPLCNVEAINDRYLARLKLIDSHSLWPESRLNAIEDLNSQTELSDILRQRLKSIPDLERMIARIHAGTAKLSVFLDVLKAFEEIWVGIPLMLSTSLTSLPQGMLTEYLDEDVVSAFRGKCLRDIVTIKGHSGVFPNLGPLLKEFTSSFDRQTAFLQQVPVSLTCELTNTS